MKKYIYTVSTNTIWTSFDYGEVEAGDYADARKMAEAELKYNFAKANEVLASCDITKGFTIEFDKSQIEIKEL